MVFWGTVAQSIVDFVCRPIEGSTSFERRTRCRIKDKKKRGYETNVLELEEP